MGGAYRSSIINIRSMLETTYWLTIAVFDKSTLTFNEAEYGKAMSIEEFEDFLQNNKSDIERKKNPRLPKSHYDNLNAKELHISVTNPDSRLKDILTQFGVCKDNEEEVIISGHDLDQNKLPEIATKLVQSGYKILKFDPHKQCKIKNSFWELYAPMSWF